MAACLVYLKCGVATASKYARSLSVGLNPLPSPQPFKSKHKRIFDPRTCCVRYAPPAECSFRDGPNPLTEPRNGQLTCRTRWGATYRQLSSTQPEFSAAPGAQGGCRGGRASMLLPVKGVSDGPEVVTRLDPGPIKTTLFQNVETATIDTQMLISSSSTRLV